MLPFGGSIPSLATIIAKDLHDFGRSSSVRSQSAFVRCMAQKVLTISAVACSQDGLFVSVRQVGT